MSAARVAVCQIAPVIGDLEGNRARGLAAIDADAEAGAGIVVLPELASSGYLFRDPAEARGLAEPPDGPTVAGWAERAAAHDVVVVGGFAEAAGGGVLHNSAALVDASGPRAVYRKVHLWDAEPLFFTPGEAPPPVVDTPHGRIATMVCYDIEFPEWVRLPALAGAELLCVPTNWPRVEDWPAGERPMEVLRAMASAATNRMAIAVCDRCGEERGVTWVSGSAIIGADGWPLAGPSAAGEPVTLVADVDLAASRDKAVGPRNDAFGDRRPALYT